jgi:hypothetical protein
MILQKVIFGGTLLEHMLTILLLKSTPFHSPYNSLTFLIPLHIAGRGWFDFEN